MEEKVAAARSRRPAETRGTGSRVIFHSCHLETWSNARAQAGRLIIRRNWQASAARYSHRARRRTRVVKGRCRWEVGADGWGRGAVLYAGRRCVLYRRLPDISFHVIPAHERTNGSARRRLSARGWLLGWWRGGRTRRCWGNRKQSQHNSRAEQGT